MSPSTPGLEYKLPLPSWESPELGTMKRVALWLLMVVGAGNAFTKEELRNAFPGVSQVDRRMRDLRNFGWRIDTNREDANLDPHEHRFVKVGIPVWEPGKATPPRETAAIGAAERRKILMRDGNMCRSCGIGPGERYEGSYESAQLDIARRKARQADGSLKTELLTECNRCRVGARSTTADLGDVLGAVGRLGAGERARLARWISNDRRDFTTLEHLWSTYRTLPSESRVSVQVALGLELDAQA